MRDGVPRPDAPPHGELVGSLEQFGEMAGTIARELGAPLTAIEVAAGRLNRDMEGGGPIPELRIVLEQSQRLAALARTLLALACPVEPRLRVVDANQAARVVAQLAWPELKRDAIDLILELDHGPLLAHADPHQLRRALLALVANARLALHGWGGTRELRLRTEWLEDGRIRIRVLDSGPGIPPGQEERIFLPFVSGWGREGMGLPHSRISAMKQGGDLRLVSAGPGGGGADFGLILEPARKLDGRTRSVG